MVTDGEERDAESWKGEGFIYAQVPPLSPRFGFLQLLHQHADSVFTFLDPMNPSSTQVSSNSIFSPARASMRRWLAVDSKTSLIS
jgi:hypothetical protein